VITPLFVGKNLIELNSVDSTNAYASKLLSEKVFPEGTVIRADFQSSGKGYAGNLWQSEPGKNLLLSVIFYPSFLAPRHQFFLNQVSSLAVVNTVEAFLLNDEVRIKWPNDIFVGDKKIGGILIENSIQGQSIVHSVMGIGLNINQQKFEPALSLATSFFKIVLREFSLEEVMHELFSQLEKRYLQLRQQRIDVLQKDYMKKLFRVDELSRFVSGGKKFTGKIAGITGEGKLIIETSGKHDVFGFKEVEMILD
jgi:BirA family transcriptional regulator, biotin operon repressor / biotin---[acetyl-CoA-carboxylase] ligase